MKAEFIILSIISYFVIGCAVPNTNNFTASSPQFKGKYKSFFQPEEIEINSWYHYVKTKTKNEKYILRKFFPETMTITSEVIYADSKLNLAEGQAIFWWENGNKKREGEFSYNKEEGVL